MAKKKTEKQIQELFFSHEEQADLFGTKRINRIFRMLETARKDLNDSIREGDSLTNQRVHKLAKQIDGIRQDLAQRIYDEGPQDKPLAELVKGHFAVESEAVIGTAINLELDQISPAILEEVSLNNLVFIKDDIVGSQLRTIKNRLFTKIGVQGQGVKQVAKELTGPGGEFQGMYSRIETIIRTETSTVYNAQKQKAITEANKIEGVQFNKRIVERIDMRRNHPISLCSDGLVQAANKPFKIKVSDVLAAARSLKKPLRRGKGGTYTSIFWPEVDGFFVGMAPPLHFRERGTLVPTEKPISDSQK